MKNLTPEQLQQIPSGNTIENACAWLKEGAIQLATLNEQIAKMRKEQTSLATSIYRGNNT